MKYYCRPFDPDKDRKIIEGLWQRNLSKVPDLRFDWLFKDSHPAANVFSWLLFKGDNPCGSISIFTRYFEFADKAISGGIFIDIIVDKAHRTLFPALTLVKTAIEGAKASGLDFLLAFPNEKAQAVFSRSGFKRISKPVRWSRIINFNAKINRYIENPLLRKFVCKIISTGIGSVVNLRNLSFFNDVDIISDYWLGLSEYRCQINGCLEPMINDSLIQWRYKNNPLRNCRIYSVRSSSDMVSIVYFIDATIAIIESIYWSNPRLISIALHRFAEYLKELDIEAISLCATDVDLLNSQLKKGGFVRRYSDRRLLGLELNTNCLSNAMDGHIVMFDGDMDI